MEGERILREETLKVCSPHQREGAHNLETESFPSLPLPLPPSGIMHYTAQSAPNTQTHSMCVISRPLGPHGIL